MTCCHFTRRVKNKCLPANTSFWGRQFQNRKLQQFPSKSLSKVLPAAAYLSCLMQLYLVQGWEAEKLDSSQMGRWDCPTEKTNLSCLQQQSSLSTSSTPRTDSSCLLLHIQTDSHLLDWRDRCHLKVHFLGKFSKSRNRLPHCFMFYLGVVIHLTAFESKAQSTNCETYVLNRKETNPDKKSR